MLKVYGHYIRNDNFYYDINKIVSIDVSQDYSLMQRKNVWEITIGFGGDNYVVLRGKSFETEDEAHEFVREKIIRVQDIPWNKW